MLRASFTEHDVAEFEAAMRSASPLETGAFFLLREASAGGGVRLVASEPYLPDDSEWARRGPDTLTPSSALLSKVTGMAAAARTGLLFVHSHPDPRHPTGFSITDDGALDLLRPVMSDVLDGPFAAAVAGPNGWVGRRLADDRWMPVDRITSAGRHLRILSPAAPATEPARLMGIDDRQRRALGGLHDVLAQLDVAVVGAGGLGSPLVETLVRMGVAKVSVIDRDVLDDPSGLRRVFGAAAGDLVDPPKAKAAVVGDHARSLGLGVHVEQHEKDVRCRDALPALLGADVILCGTDSHASRAYLNSVAYALHLPLVDAGARVGAKTDGTLDALAAEVRVAAPGLPCLWCMSVLSADEVRAENLEPEERERLKRDGYITGLGEAVPSVAALTVTGAGLMACALLGVLTEAPDLPQRYRLDALQAALIEPPVSRREGCICRRVTGRGVRGLLA